MSKVGRPRLSDRSLVRDRHVVVKLNAEELRHIRALAELDQARSISSYLRALIMKDAKRRGIPVKGA
jgi:hypothetical protein